MKIFVEKAKLENELRLFQGIFEKKAIMEILQNIKLTALDGGVLEMVATDLEIGLTANIQVDIKSPGSFTVNGKDLYDLVSRCRTAPSRFRKTTICRSRSQRKKDQQVQMLGLQSSITPSCRPTA
jgi:DNA polymerase III sliding clamp (beta) subunit (PCNA family)